MTDRFDHLLHDVIHDLADGGAQLRPDERAGRRLALEATDRGYRYRARRRAGLAGVVVIVALLAFGVPYVVRGLGGPGRGVEPGAPVTGSTTLGTDGVPTITFADTDRPIELIDGWYVLGNRKVLNRIANSYVTVPATTLIPSPNGLWVATVSGESWRYRVYDLEHGGSHLFQINFVSGAEGPLSWSPDGRTLLGSAHPIISSPYPAETPVVAILIDVEAETSEARPLLLGGTPCVQQCQLDWMPSGTEIALVLQDDTDPSRRVPTGIQTFDLNGNPLRQLPVRGYPAGNGAWSPDGQSVIVTADGAAKPQLVSTVTGEVIRDLAGGGLQQAQWIDNDRYLAWTRIYHDGADVPLPLKAELWTRGGVLLQRWFLPIEIAGWVPNIGPLAVKFD